MIEELTKKNEDLELAVKTASAKTPFINRQDTASSTTGRKNVLFTNKNEIISAGKLPMCVA